jgi:hypothetical protein
MSIRKGSKIIAGSGGSGDGDSIKNQNLVSPITKVYDWIGTLEEYEEQQVATSHPDWVCFILDDTKQYNHQLTNRNVGDIFYTLRKDEELNGAVECNGNTYDFTDFTGKESISNLLKADKLPYISLSEYTTQLEATNGTVGVFGWDGGETTTFRVPKLEDIFVESGNINNVGEFMPAGLPNITGSFDAGTFAGTTNGAGAFTGATAPYNWALRGTYTGGYGAHYPFDASNSNTIYGSSTTVQPKAIRYRPMIQLSTGFADEAVETCQSVKADVENLKGYDYVVDWQVPTSENNYTWYRKYKSGWVEQGGEFLNEQPDVTHTITLPVVMASNHYHALWEMVGRGSVRVLRVVQRSTTTLKVGSDTWNTELSDPDVDKTWYVSGMSA